MVTLLSQYVVFNKLISIYVCAAVRPFFGWLVSADVSANVVSCSNVSLMSLSAGVLYT